MTLGQHICVIYNCLYIKIVSSIFEALNNCQYRRRVGKLGVQTSAKKGGIFPLIGIGFMYLPNIRSTIVPRVSVQGVESPWGDCRFIPADWGS